MHRGTRTKRWRLHVLAGIVSFSPLKVSRRLGRPTFGGQSPLPITAAQRRRLSFSGIRRISDSAGTNFKSGILLVFSRKRQAISCPLQPAPLSNLLITDQRRSALRFYSGSVLADSTVSSEPTATVFSRSQEQSIFEQRSRADSFPRKT
jgi:hypothetical protein